ncbi:MAG: glycine cleavage system aminomethyltransferase GcvT [Planctomycetes bacterium]|nr:glycine cleavage system aminomethyltransferase GcvT [Planctomycetota bacterium]
MTVPPPPGPGAGPPAPGAAASAPDGAGPAGPAGSGPAILARTCLIEEHRALGATLVDFHGWEMPVRYGSIPEEHEKVRLSAGLFDLCHMGRLEVAGPGTRDWVQRLITNDLDAMAPGDARYTLIANESGTIIDDAIAYKLPSSVLLVVNASNRASVLEWMVRHKGGLDATLADRTGELAMVAVQGPQAARILPALVEDLEGSLEGMKYYSIARGRILGSAAWIARTGYTGEDGFEVFLDAGLAPAFWRRALEVGGSRIAPVGLGARDTLRLEAGMPLYGHEIDLTTDPFEAGLGFAVKLEKPADFIGKASLAERRARGPARRLVGFRVLGRRVARQGMKVLKEGEEAGTITSGAPSPTLGCPIAMGYLSAAAAGAGPGSLEVDVRGHRERLEVVPLPFYSRTRKKKTR